MRIKILSTIILLSFLFLPAVAMPAQAQDNQQIFNSSGLPIPRFVSLRSNKVFVRTGPALRYPIKWIFVRKNMPIEIIQEFDTWRKIRDVAGEEGWIHQSLLSGRRNAVIMPEGGAMISKKPEIAASPVAKLERGVIFKLKQCQTSWCLGEAGGFEGWIEKKSLWGVYASEELD